MRPSDVSVHRTGHFTMMLYAVVIAVLGTNALASARSIDVRSVPLCCELAKDDQ